MKNRFVEEMEELFFRDACRQFEALIAGEDLSAKTVYRNLYVAMQVKNTYYYLQTQYRSVADLLLKTGYPEDAVQRFREMRQKEKEHEKA